MAAVKVSTVAEAIGAPPDAVKAAKAWFPNIEAWGDLYACAPHVITLDLEGGTYTRERHSLRMGKRGCEDWAAMVWTENAELTVDGDAEAEYLASVLGEDFNSLLADHVEGQTFARGIGAIEVLVNGMTVSDDGSVAASSETSVSVAFVPATNVIPLRWTQRGITEAAIVSYDGRHVDVRIHRPGSVESLAFLADENGSALRPRELPEGIAPLVTLAEPVPLLAVTKPGIANNVDPESPYGISVLANATSQLDAVDTAFDNFVQDFVLGGKMVFIPDTMLRHDSNGNAITPDRDRKQLFVQVNDAMGDSRPGITEHNPTIRVEENVRGIDTALSLYSNALGMGAERYRYRDGAIATATQIVSENSDMYRTRRRHIVALTYALHRIAYAVLWCGRNLAGLPLDVDAEIVVRTDDSVIEDDGARIARGLAYFSAGAISHRTFLIDYYGMTEEEADAELTQMPSAPLY